MEAGEGGKGLGQPPTHQFGSQAFPFRRNLQQRVNEIETSTGYSRHCIQISLLFSSGTRQPRPPAGLESAVLQCKQICSEQGFILAITERCCGAMRRNIRYINMCLSSCLILNNDLNKYHFKKNDQEKKKD